MLVKANSHHSLFISHRHVDRGLADIFRLAFEEWSNSHVKVFQSSNAKSAPDVGDELDDIIRKAAAESGVVLLIYTGVDDDWMWCMYECGLAQNPETLDTRILVFHPFGAPPAPLQHLITLPMSRDAIETLVHQFHKARDFFPGCGDAVAPEVTEDQLKQRSMDLYNRLLEEIPGLHTRASVRYGQMTLSMLLDDVQQIKKVYETESFAETLKFASALLSKHCKIERFWGEPYAHFNFEDITENQKFSVLIERWKKESEHSELAWDEELYAEMTRAMLNIKEGALSIPFNSLDPDTNAWFLPILHSIRFIPQKARMEMDLSLCKLKAEAAHLMIRKG